jgi:transcriptional regulator GlxA family with amidase domain
MFVAGTVDMTLSYGVSMPLLRDLKSQVPDAICEVDTQFSRAFRAETGQSPAKAVENLRVEAARLMMGQSRHPIDVIAQQTGFADRDRMRRASPPAFRQQPQVIRQNARVQASA